MAGGFPLGTPVLNFVAPTTDPSATQNTDGSLAPLSSGREGGLYTNSIHGDRGGMALRGNVFYMSTVIAGVALPVNAATLASKFTLWNPAGSNRFVELLEVTVGIDSATEVVNGFALGFQAGVSTGGGAPGTLTVMDSGPLSSLIGAGRNSVCKGYKAATLTNAAVLPIYPLGLNFDATAAGRSGNFVADLKGSFILPPDTIVTILTTVAAETATPIGMLWAEWLP